MIDMSVATQRKKEAEIEQKIKIKIKAILMRTELVIQEQGYYAMPGHGYGYRPRTWDCVHMTSEAVLTAFGFYFWVIRKERK